MTTVDDVRAAARQLPPVEQLQLIQDLLQGIAQSYPQTGSTIPATVRRAPPVTTLDDLVAPFWPEDETADQINDYIGQQRAADRLRDQ